MFSTLTLMRLPSIFMLFWLTPVICLAYIALRRTSRLYKNYRLVHHLSPTVPIIIAPWTWQDPFWLMLGPQLAPLLQNVPGFRSWVWCSYMGWTTVDRGRVHLPESQGGRGYGPNFILVSPSRTEFFTTDAGVAVEVARDWKTYSKPPDLYAVFDIFGKNVNTVNGDDWQRHRKITGGAFTREATLGLVWNEARRSAQKLIGQLLKGSENRTNKTKRAGEHDMSQVREIMSLLTMHVLSIAAFGKRQNDTLDPGATSHTTGPGTGSDKSTNQALSSAPDQHKLSYFDTIQTVVPNLLGVVMFGGTNLPTWLLPSAISKIKLAVDEYQLYLREAISLSQSIDVNDNAASGTDLASSLLKANDAEKTLDTSKGGVKSYLTDDELHGNMFMFSFAGFETTSMALSFAMPYIALNEGIWDWVKEEVDVVLKEQGAQSLDSYEKCFERLVRCRALIYEALRLHNAVAHVPRQTPLHHGTTIDIPHPKHPNTNEKFTLDIPPNSLFSIPIVIQGYLPDQFPEPYTFDPRRFLASPSNPNPSNLPPSKEPWGVETSTAGKEALIGEKQLALLGFQPWTSGPRVCPGRKFSQVEFVAVIAELVKSGVRVGLRGGGDKKKEENEGTMLQEGVRDVVFNLGARIRREGEVGVRFFREG